MNCGLMMLINAPVTKGSASRIHADRRPSAESVRTLPSSLRRARTMLRDVVQQLGQIAARLALDQHGDHEVAEVRHRHALGQPHQRFAAAARRSSSRRTGCGTPGRSARPSPRRPSSRRSGTHARRASRGTSGRAPPGICFSNAPDALGRAGAQGGTRAATPAGRHRAAARRSAAWRAAAATSKPTAPSDRAQ